MVSYFCLWHQVSLFQKSNLEKSISETSYFTSFNLDIQNVQLNLQSLYLLHFVLDCYTDNCNLNSLKFIYKLTHPESSKMLCIFLHTEAFPRTWPPNLIPLFNSFLNNNILDIWHCKNPSEKLSIPTCESHQS